MIGNDAYVSYQYWMIKVICRLNWDVQALADSMGITARDVLRMFKNDGRIYPHILKPRLARELEYREYISFGDPSPAQLIDDENGLWQIRAMTKSSGVSFMRQSMRSTGIEYNEKKFLDYVSRLAGFLVCDVRSFPELVVYEVSKESVWHWHEGGRLCNGLMAYGSFKEAADQTELPL